MNLRDIESQAKAMAPIVREFVKKSVETLENKLFSAIDERFNALKAEIPQPTELDLACIAQAAAELIPAPEKGEDGKSVTIEDVQPLITEEVGKAIAVIPVPKDGIDGKDGEKGADGKSFTLEEVQELVNQAVFKAVSELPAPKDGENGANGVDGKDGASVSTESVQAMIDEGVAKAVAELPKAVNGENGRDALDIEILPAIDHEKSYPRSTYAMHNGGLWKSFQKTEGMMGWECLIEGVAKFHVEQVDERNFVAVSEMSSGKTERKSIALPTMLYRQIWKEGTIAQKGDCFTWGGSVWHCEKDTDSKPSEGHECWKLAVKKGRDAK